MEHNFWIERWNKQDIGFHQADFDPALGKYWSQLDVPAGGRVLVPLCGKSLDMVWLAQQGYSVIGAELSERAVDDFFSERGLAPDTRCEADFIIKSSGPYEIWCGDFFALPQSAVAGVSGVYDRAALVALPADLQRRYAAKMKSLLPDAQILLVSLDYDQREMSGPPFATPRTTIEDLFSDHYDCTELVVKDVLAGYPHFQQRGVTALTGAAYVLRPR
ncbi:MAG: thiopurine S-methyltransferase [Hyphomicrobium sp.]|jgi:thiopurine S-methyltransferase